jgi:hypothetical protein
MMNIALAEVHEKRPIAPMEAKVSPGQVVCTPGVLETFDRTDLILSLSRHLRGDWGDIAEADKIANDDVLLSGGRLFSAYWINNTAAFWIKGEKLWIITEADRSATTLLLPSEY